MWCLMFVLLSGIASVGAVPIQSCSGGAVYVADDDDLCRFHWCVSTVSDGNGETGAIGITTMEMACAPGSRVPTWFVSSADDMSSPCSEDHSTEKSCLRCDYADVPEQLDENNCNPNPCPSDCTCQDLWNAYYCLCPGNVPPTFETVTSGDFFCDPDPCRNGARCYSQWDDYWCQCPRGFTGKNCEMPVCEPNPCMNGGVCVLDNINYHCQCDICFDGSCCEIRIANGPQCDEGRVPPPTPPPPTSTTSRVCSECQYGDNCELTRVELCLCNPCPSSGQICYDREAPFDRECVGKPGTQGSQYTVTFSQDSGAGSTYKRVYVHIAGAEPDGNARTVRIYTPNIQPGQPCYVDMTVTVSINNPAYYDVPAECLNTESGGVEDGKVLRVMDPSGQELIVTVSNRDGDGYLAIPDNNAGQYYISHSYFQSGEDEYITIVALSDNTEVAIQTPDQEVFNSNPTVSNVMRFQLNALQSVRYASRDLAGSVITSNRDIHVWSGNMDESSQKTAEQLPSVNTWGAASDSYTYIVMGVASQSINTADVVHMQTALETDYTLYRILANGVKVLVTDTGRAAANTDTLLGSLSEGQAFELMTNQPVQVTHSLRAEASNGQNFYSSYTLIPAVALYAQSYSFQTHGERDNVGNDFTRHYLTLVSQREINGIIPGYVQEIDIYHYNIDTGVNTTYTAQELGANWKRITGNLYGTVVELPSPGTYYLSNPSIQNYSFGAVYYAVSGTTRSQMPNAAFPLGYDMTQLNNIPAPVICPRCTAGPNCELPVINTCVCNPCTNFDDRCTDSVQADVPRICVGSADVTGNPFTVMYMQNARNNTDKRELELYVTSAGPGNRDVRVYSPSLAPDDPCYFSISRVIPGFEVSLFTIPDAECFETVGSGVFNNKAVRVESEAGDDMLVYAVNRDRFSADGWVAFPDIQAGTDFYTVSHDPPHYGSQFGVVNLQDVPVNIVLTYTGRATPNIADTNFQLPAGHVLQIQSDGDLSGTRIQSDRPVNVYSGNIRALVNVVEDPAVGNINTGSRDHLVEQLMPVSRWGRTFNIEPIPGRRFGDQLKVVGSAAGTVCTLYRRQPDGTVSNETFTLGSGDVFTRDVISDNTYRLTSNNKIFVAQITKSQERGTNIHDPSLITIPPVEQYSNRFLFNTPLFSGGTDAVKRPYEFKVLIVTAREEDRNEIQLAYGESSTFISTFISSLGTWKPIPESSYYSIALELQDGTSIIYHEDADNVQFMCIFYGYDDRESLGFPIGMKLEVVN